MHFVIGKKASATKAPAVEIADMIASISRDRQRRGHPGAGVRVRVLQRSENIEVWLFRKGHRAHRRQTIRSALAIDAMRYGQDLVDELVGDALQDIERRSVRPVKRGFR